MMSQTEMSAFATVVRTLRRYLHGKYQDVGDHFVYEDFESFGTLESQGQATYRCVDCGEEHKRTSSFSAACGDGQYNTGGETVTHECVVTDVDDRYVWVTILEDQSPVSIPLPKYHTEYTADLRARLADADSEDHYTVTFIAENADGTAWYCGGLEALE